MKKKYIKYINLGLFLFFVILSTVFFLVLKNKNLSISNSNLGELSSVPSIKEWNSTSHNLYSNTNFWISYLGFNNFIHISKNNFWNAYVISTIFFLPIFSIVCFIQWGSFLLNFVFARIRRIDLIKRNKIMTIIFLIILSLFLIVLFVNTIIVESYENNKIIFEQFEYYYGTISNKVISINNRSILLDIIRLLNVFIADNNLHALTNNDIPSACANSMIVIIIVVPILAFLVVLLFTILTSFYTVLYRYNLIGERIRRIKLWVRYKNISTKKEVIERYFECPATITTMITFLFSMIFPVLIPIYFFQFPIIYIILILMDICVIILSFLPIMFLIFYTKSMQPHAYNLCIFIQICVFLVVGLFWQIFIWIVWNNRFIYFDYVPLIVILLYLISSFISIYLFARNK